MISIGLYLNEEREKKVRYGYSLVTTNKTEISRFILFSKNNICLFTFENFEMR